MLTAKFTSCRALKLTPPGETVRIDGGGGSRVVVRVRARGRGIPRSQRTHAFEPLWRGRDGTPGSGLGLAICRGFVEANGGTIQLQSAQGDGTTFAVSFPRVGEPARVG